jgi:hypothetical protein
MALDIKIQQTTKTYRDELLAMSSSDVRALAGELGIDGHETTPIVTLVEEIAQTWRDDTRADAYDNPQLASYPDASGAQPGNPGNDNPSLLATYEPPE